MTAPKFELPAALVDRMARALYEAEWRDPAEAEWNELSDENREGFRKVQRAVAAVLLDECEVEYRYGTELNGEVHGAYDIGTARRLTSATNAHSRSRGHGERARLVRRLLITTPAEDP